MKVTPNGSPAGVKPLGSASALMPSFSTPRTTGVTRPTGVETATEMSTVEYLRIDSPFHTALAAGTACSAAAMALISRSLTLILTGLI